VAATASSGAGEMMRHANLGASMASAGLLAKREAIEDKWCRSGAESFDTSDVPGRKLRTSDVSGTEEKKKTNLFFCRFLPLPKPSETRHLSLSLSLFHVWSPHTDFQVKADFFSS
jgi:hypothetical protein